MAALPSKPVSLLVQYPNHDGDHLFYGFSDVSQHRNGDRPLQLPIRIPSITGTATDYGYGWMYHVNSGDPHERTTLDRQSYGR